MFRYSIGGLVVEAGFPVEGLQVFHDATAATDIWVTLTDRLPEFVAGPLEERCQWPGRYGLRLAEAAAGWLFSTGEHGSFAIPRDGRYIHCIPGGRFGCLDPHNAGGAPDGLCQMLMRRILPRVVQLHNRLGLHGASIRTSRGHAFLVLGASGAGKSTLSAALHDYLGWDVLSDDMSLIEVGDTSSYCFSVVKGASLWPDSLDTLMPARRSARPLPGHAGKLWRNIELDNRCLSAPLAALIFLDQAGEGLTDISWKRISASEGLRLVMRQLIRFNPRDNQALPDLMKRVNRLTSSVPFFVLSYPRRFELLPDVVARIQQELAAGH